MAQGLEQPWALLMLNKRLELRPRSGPLRGARLGLRSGLFATTLATTAPLVGLVLLSDLDYLVYALVIAFAGLWATAFAGAVGLFGDGVQHVADKLGERRKVRAGAASVEAGCLTEVEEAGALSEAYLGLIDAGVIRPSSPRGEDAGSTSEEPQPAGRRGVRSIGW